MEAPIIYRLSQSMVEVSETLKQTALLWLAGFKEACCFHRVISFCRRSRMLSVRTGQCFLLNGLIFLGSVYTLNSIVIPTLLWILPNQGQQRYSQHSFVIAEASKLYSFLRDVLIVLFYILWFIPLFIFSFCLSNVWYNDIAKYAFESMEMSNKLECSKQQYSTSSERQSRIDKVIFGFSEQIYSILLLTIFCLEVYAAGSLPYVGKAIKFLLLSWMYAYYCFEYKWNFFQLELGRRLNFFESNWAFFAGFGSPCVIAIFFVSPLLSYGFMGILFPLH